jgi:hypothetical protein
LKVELGKSKFHEVELDLLPLVHISFQFEDVAERNYRLAKTLRLWASRRNLSVELVQWRLKDKIVIPLRSTSQAACKPVHEDLDPAIG